MRQQLWTPPNLLSLLRLLLLPFLWVFALLDLPVHLGVGLTTTVITDVLDGALARRLNQVTEFGSELDTLADNLIIASVAIWLILLRPSIFTSYPLVWFIVASLALINVLVGWIKFNRFANLHLYSTKAAGVVTTVFVVHTLLSSEPSERPFYVASGMVILSLLEALFLQLTHSHVNEHMGSILLVSPNKWRPGQNGG